MEDAVIVSTARTPIGKAYRGAFNATAGVDLAAPILRAVIERAKVEPGEVEELTFGCGYPEGATGGNVARHTAFRAGLPASAAALDRSSVRYERGRMVGHALLEGRRRKAKWAVVTMCVAGGMGCAGLLEIF
jgi:acetyl-CoA C-acetyltransferase